jgi:hypothetical protein
MLYLFKSSVAVAALTLVGTLTACDRLGTTSERMATEDPIACGGFAGLECPDGLVCTDDPGDDCDPQNGGADCGGICEPAPPAFCGGFAGIACPEGQVCVDDPGDDCDPKNGGADCGGICEPAPEVTPCGGFANISCPKGQVCVDDPGDDCDPKNGGADCGGICEDEPKHLHKPHKPHKPHHPRPHDTCKDPDRSYVSHDPAACAAIRFICADDKSAFFDDCGCGCE